MRVNTLCIGDSDWVDVNSQNVGQATGGSNLPGEGDIWEEGDMADVGNLRDVGHLSGVGNLREVGNLSGDGNLREVGNLPEDGNLPGVGNLSEEGVARMCPVVNKSCDGEIFPSLSILPASAIASAGEAFFTPLVQFFRSKSLAQCKTLGGISSNGNRFKIPIASP